jgi:hypothetical protein
LARSEQFGEEKNAIEQEKQEAAKGPAKSAIMGGLKLGMTENAGCRIAGTL